MLSIKSILFPTDFSDASRAAHLYLLDYAKQHGAQVHLLHVLENFVTPVDFAWTSTSAAEFEAKRNVHAQDELEALARRLELGDNAVLAIENGHPFERIIAYAKEKEIDLIVMATHGRTGLNHLLMGSQAERVVRTAPCPVLTVRTPKS